MLAIMAIFAVSVVCESKCACARPGRAPTAPGEISAHRASPFDAAGDFFGALFLRWVGGWDRSKERLLPRKQSNLGSFPDDRGPGPDSPPGDQTAADVGISGGEGLR